jgi:hypothetical protein
MNTDNKRFPIDGGLASVFHRGGASLKNPDAQLPILRGDAEGSFLQVTIEADPHEPSEIPITRRIPLENLSEEDWENLKLCYRNMDFQKVIEQGLSAELEKIHDVKLQRLFMSFLTFLNPRQVAILIYLYREASIQGNGSTVFFQSNDLLTQLGYSLCNDGNFNSKARAQLNRDLVSLHWGELVIPVHNTDDSDSRRRFDVRGILKIKQFVIDRGNRQEFDWQKAADYTYELADGYTIELSFFELERGGDYVLIPENIDLRQKSRGQTSNDYRMKLLTYLVSRVARGDLEKDRTLSISRTYLLKNLGLYGSNESRKNSILWDTIQKLIDEKILKEAEQIQSGKTIRVRFHFSEDMIEYRSPNS